MNSSPSSRPSVVVAELGPTNTGKTHRAIERMLEHDSGIMGLPLRLLAREVYDRVTARVGEGRVALMTGEEKRLPPRPDYWICTVEAMPPELAMRVLRQAVADDQTQLTVTDIDWAKFAPSFTAARHRPFIGDLPEVRRALSPEADPVEAGSPDEVPAFLERIGGLTAALGLVLGGTAGGAHGVGSVTAGGSTTAMDDGRARPGAADGAKRTRHTAAATAVA